MAVNVYLLYDYGHLFEVYADREAANVDRAVLLAQARADLPGRADEDYARRVEIVEVTPRTGPRLKP